MWALCVRVCVCILIWAIPLPVCVNGRHNKASSAAGNSLIPLWCFGLAYCEGKRGKWSFSSLAVTLWSHKSMSHHVHSFDLQYNGVPQMHRVWLELPCFLLKQCPGKTISEDSHIFTETAAMLVLTRGCFGLRPCVFRTWRELVWEFPFIV